MGRIRKPKCRHCKTLFDPDRRNLRHQTYCSEPACRKASKSASQRRWLNKSENQDYFRGPAHVKRVQEWRLAHPGYWHREADLKDSALQEHYITQSIEAEDETKPIN